MAAKKPSLNEAIALWNANERDQARKLFEQVVIAKPDDEKAWLWLARTANSRQRQFQALQKVLEINPGNSVAQRVMQERFASTPLVQITDLLGDAAFAEDWQHAESIYHQILKLDAQQPDAIEALLDHYAHTGEWDKGYGLITNIRRASRSLSHEVVTHTVTFALQGKNLDFLRSLDSTLLNHPAVNADHLLKVSALFAHAKQYSVVAALLERAAELDDKNQTVLYGLAKAYEVTERPAEAKRIRQRIADIDRHSGVGKNIMDMFLEEDPYVPLSIRENTWVAVREAIGLALPIVVLLFMDNGLSFAGFDRIFGIVLAIGGSYLLVTATSSHEQKFWKRLIPEGLDDALRYGIGATGSLLILVALYLSLRTSFDHVSEHVMWENQACEKLIAAIQTDIPLTGDPEYRQADPCNWLRERLYYYFAEE